MLRKSFLGAAVSGAALTLVLAVAGCGSGTAAPQATDSDAGAAARSQAVAATNGKHAGEHGEADHAHKPGMHGGIIVPIGRDSYHAEAVFEQGATLRLFTLGRDEGRVQEVDSQTLTAYVKAAGGTDFVAFTLEPEPLSDDAEGKTSQFVGKLPENFAGQPVEITIPSLRIKGERFRLAFTSTSEHEETTDHGGSAMPGKVADAEERELYLAPGGHYTVADIEANGRMTASQKFKGIRATHDMKPKAGDKLCPVTMTKANPKFSWVVGGKTYEFCCPPCVDEFVAQAKAGEEIGEPQDYVKE